MAGLSARKRRFCRTCAVLVCLTAVILGYGYWHAATHATYHVSLSLVDKNGARSEMPLAEVTFFDAAGRLLAEGVNDEKYDYLHLLHPEAGDCHEVESSATTSPGGRTAWQECFAKMSAWIPGWIEDVQAVDVRYNGQDYEKLPVKVTKGSADWLLWWVPLPHVGGKPYTYYRSTIRIAVDEQ